MEYRRTVPFTGDHRKAVDSARNVFVNNNFRIDSATGSEIVARGEGLLSTRQNPLLGATEVHIKVDTSSIELIAVLGGIQRINMFLFIFPAALALFLSLFFYILQMTKFTFFIPWAALSPWVVISPLLGRMVKKRTITALDTLLHNLQIIGQNG